jgi:hypothetical protein
MSSIPILPNLPPDQYSATADQTTFIYTFPIFEDKDLQVYR